MQELLDDIFPSDKDDSSLKRAQILLLGMCLQLGFLLVALILAIDDIESIIETGPIGSILGIVVFVFAHLSKFPRGKKVGLSAPIFSVICFSLIYFLDWSPREAEIPIATLMAIYGVGLFFVIVIEFQKYRKKKNTIWDEDLSDV